MLHNEVDYIIYLLITIYRYWLYDIYNCFDSIKLKRICLIDWGNIIQHSKYSTYQGIQICILFKINAAIIQYDKTTKKKVFE